MTEDTNGPAPVGGSPGTDALMAWLMSARAERYPSEVEIPLKLAIRSMILLRPATDALVRAVKRELEDTGLCHGDIYDALAALDETGGSE